MRVKKIFLIGVISLWMGHGFVSASTQGVLKMRFFRGDRVGTNEPIKAVTSSYLQPTFTANFQSRFEPADEAAQIKKVFNLIAVDLITEADFSYGKSLGMIGHGWRFDGKIYSMTLASFSGSKIQIEVFEQMQEKKISLLDTEFNLPGNNIAVFGFEDLQGIPYFLSFYSPYKAQGEEMGGFAGELFESGDKKALDNAVRAIGEIHPPQLLQEVSPIYPEIARQAKVEGLVILEAVTDEAGYVVWVRVLRSIPLLNQAAMDAVKQWKYEPYFLDGEPKGVIFTVTVRFKLK